MKVVLATPYPVDPSYIPGGIRAAAYNLVQGLKSLPDMEIHVIYCHSDVPRDAVVKQDNVTVHYLAMPKERIIPNLIRGLGRIRRRIEEIAPDVINAHLSHYAVAALRSGYPTVWTIHWISHREIRVVKRLFDRLSILLFIAYDAYALRKVKDIVAISPYVMEEYSHRTKARWHLINNPVSEEFFGLEARERPNRLLMVGSMNELKDAMTLLRALDEVRRHLPEVELHFIGRVTNPGYLAGLKEFVRRQGLEGNVHFLGLVDMARIWREYSECAVLVHPSRQEVAPMVVMEAMAVGKPVVATRVGGVPGLVRDGETGFLVQVGDSQAMARGILTLLRDARLRREMGARAREIALRQFRLSEVARRYREVYRGMLT